jgi:hypothetical protein
MDLYLFHENGVVREMTQRRGVIWAARAEKIGPEDVFQIRRSGLLVSFSTLIQLFALFIFIVLPDLFSFRLFAPYAGYIILFTVFCANILLLLALVTGMRSLTSVSGSGKGFLWLAVISLMIATLCIPLSLLLFQEGPIWFVLGVITAPYSLSGNLVFHLWHATITLSLVVYSLTFGWLLIKHEETLGYGNLTTPGIFLVVQGSLQTACIVLANIGLAYYGSLSIIRGFVLGFSIFCAVFVTVLWFLYLGYQFRLLPYSDEGDGWDRFRRRLRESPSVQGFLARRGLGIIALILAVGVTIEVIAVSILRFWYFGGLWWVAVIAIFLGFCSLKFEHPNGYAITALGLASLCWVVGSIIAIQIYIISHV